MSSSFARWRFLIFSNGCSNAFNFFFSAKSAMVSLLACLSSLWWDNCITKEPKCWGLYLSVAPSCCIRPGGPSFCWRRRNWRTSSFSCIVVDTPDKSMSLAIVPQIFSSYIYRYRSMILFHTHTKEKLPDLLLHLLQHLKLRRGSPLIWMMFLCFFVEHFFEMQSPLLVAIQKVPDANPRIASAAPLGRLIPRELILEDLVLPPPCMKAKMAFPQSLHKGSRAVTTALAF